MSACIGQPVSWLKLEQFQLGELPPDESAQVGDHVARCPACRGCIDDIKAPVELRPLPAVLPSARRRSSAWPLAAVAAAAGVLIVLLPRPHAAPLPPARVAVKGGELSLTLVRARGGAIDADPTHFAQGDRFKVLLTCPAPSAPYVLVAVYQDGRASFPLGPARAVRCTNRLALEGAFSLSGTSPAAVCVATSEAPIEQQAVAAGLPRELRDGSACARLEAGR